MSDDRDLLTKVHLIRMEEHWGKKWAAENAFTRDRWPSSDKDWRQTDHGAPWDTNVEMARFHLRMANRISEIE